MQHGSGDDLFGHYEVKRRIVSLTPLIDVVFLLLIFFMLASTFLQTQTLSVITPPKAASETDSDRTVVEVRVAPGGTFRVDGEAAPVEELSAAIKAALGGDKEAVVSILAEKDVQVQPLISAVEAARQAGARTVATTRVGGGQ
ncbi:ExbD/TolR family protein [Tepidicaulis sp.]|jgi:biopolymer transport protein ExbD|uniref:ExbD/TolR family protein n=1 Tax=Tepidicaulis sp. TaxID=1920809 RepID=UPI003B593663